MKDDGVLDTDELAAALGLESPWYVARVELGAATGRLHLGLAYPEDHHFACPTCGVADCPIEATRPRTWRHERFLGYQALLLARLPDLGCERCGIVTVPASWERPGCDFALLASPTNRPDLNGW